MKYWTCPKCGVSNFIYLRLCQHCRYIRRETDMTLTTFDFWKCQWCGALNVMPRYICRNCHQARFRAPLLTSESKKK